MQSFLWQTRIDVFRKHKVIKGAAGTDNTGRLTLRYRMPVKARVGDCVDHVPHVSAVKACHVLIIRSHYMSFSRFQQCKNELVISCVPFRQKGEAASV